MRLQNSNSGQINSSFAEEDIKDNDNDEDIDVNLKVIVITIVASEKMNNKMDIWKDLKSTILEELETLLDSDSGKADDVVVCLNIHVKNEEGFVKIQTHKNDKAMSDNVWKQEKLKRGISELGSTDEIQQLRDLHNVGGANVVNGSIQSVLAKQEDDEKLRKYK